MHFIPPPYIVMFESVSTHCGRLLRRRPLDGHVGGGLLELAEPVAVQPRPRLPILVVLVVAGRAALAGGVDEHLLIALHTLMWHYP